jgi:hypothetical protein
VQALPAQDSRAPDFFIVGSPKTGTTALHRMLSLHPQIFMSQLKEPRFLASDLLPRPQHANDPREEGYPRTLADYLALFADAQAGQRVGEATPTYLWSRTAAGAIAELSPSARIIAILREPSSFLRSLHLSFLKGGNESEKDLRKAISFETERRAGRHIPRGSHRPQLLLYSDHVRYVEQLKRYLARFPPEQMLVLIYDDFLADNRATVRRVLRFLEVDDTGPIKIRKANPTVGVRSTGLQSAASSLIAGNSRLARATRTTIKSFVPQLASAGAHRRILFREPPALDERLMLELRERFQPEVVALSEHLDRDLVSQWGYGELG